MVGTPGNKAAKKAQGGKAPTGGTPAGVSFLTLNYKDCPEGEVPQRFAFRCPRDGSWCSGLLIANAGHGFKRDGQNKNGGVAQWDWNGNRESPTFSPSIDCKGCWHGYIKAGLCVNA